MLAALVISKMKKLIFLLLLFYVSYVNAAEILPGATNEVIFIGQTRPYEYQISAKLTKREYGLGGYRTLDNLSVEFG